MSYMLDTALICLMFILDGASSGPVGVSPQTLLRRYPSLPTATSQRPNSLMSSFSVKSSDSRSSGNNKNTITTAPATLPQESDPSDLDWCLAGTPACSGSKTWDGPPLSLADQCVLWNSSCTGNVDSAAQNFFENMVMLDEKPCWKSSNKASFSCTAYEPPETLSAMSKIKEWMRGPQCLSLSDSLYPLTISITEAGTLRITAAPVATAVGETCCGNAIIEAQNVDIYYWPGPDANTSCLSIVGDSVNPLYYGATTGAGPAYWGCTAKDPITSTVTSILDSPGTKEIWTTVTNVQSIIRTAQITEVNSLTFKIPLVNPWSPPACIGVTSTLVSSSASASATAIQMSVHARGHSLVIPSSMTQEGGLPISTVVSGTFTFTSPSVYANFHSISAADWCGEVGSEATVTQTMLTFSPGELSTIAGPLHDPVGSSYQSYSTRVFDFADLPCPPQSVMEENWYMPAPGEPYRPLIALPKKVMDIDPAYASVSDAFFTAYDPPRTLAVATAMVSDTSSIHAVASPTIPAPAAALKTGAARTSIPDVPSSVSAPTPEVHQQSKTSVLALDPAQDSSSAQPQLGTKQRGDPRTSNDSNDRSSAFHIPGLVSRSNTTESAKPTGLAMNGLDPKRVSAELMLGIESAQASESQSQLAMSQDKGSPTLHTTLSFGNQQTPGSQPPFNNDVGQQGSSVQSLLSQIVPDDPALYRSPTGVATATIPGETEHSMTASSVLAPIQSNAADGGYPIVHLPGPDSLVKTSPGGRAKESASNGPLVQVNTITAGPATPATSDAVVSVTSLQSISLEGTLYYASRSAMTTKLINGTAALPLHSGSSMDDATSSAAAAKTSALRSWISFDVNVVSNSATTDAQNSLAFVAFDSSKPIHNTPTESPTGQVIAAAMTAVQEDPTLSRGAPAVTVVGLPVSSDLAGDLLAGSETIAFESSTGGLGNSVLGGLQTGRPSANDAERTSQGSSTPGSDGSPSRGSTSQSGAEITKSHLEWEWLVLFVAVTTIWLQT